MIFCQKKFRGLLFAASASVFVTCMMNLVTSMVSGQILGERALAGVNLLASLDTFLLFIGTLLALGSSIQFTVSLGRFQQEEASKAFSCGLLASIFAGPIYAIITIIGRKFYLDFMGADKETLAFATQYWNFWLLNAAIHPVFYYLMTMVYADGDNKNSIASYITQFVVNVIVAIVLCHLMGIGGCALGMFLGKIASMFFLLKHFRLPANALKYKRYFNFKLLAKMCYGATGDASVTFCWTIVYFFLNKFIINNFGADKLPIAAVVIAACNFTSVFDGVGNAIQPLIGLYVGEGNTTCVFRTMKDAARFSVIEGLVFTILMVIFPKLVVSLVGIHDQNLVPETCLALRVVGSVYVVWAFVFLFNSYFLFVERVGLACGVTFLKDLFCPIPFFYVGGKIGGMSGMWTGYALSSVVAVAAFCLFLLKKYGKDMFPLMLSRKNLVKQHVYDLVLDEQSITDISRQIDENLTSRNLRGGNCLQIPLLVEEVLMCIKDRNGDKKISAEVFIDFTDAKEGSDEVGVQLVIKDDGEIFDITDADAQVSSFRVYLVSSMMEHQDKRNIITAGFNRNAFRF